MQLPDPEKLLAQLSVQLQDHLRQHGITRPIMLGILSGGYLLAQRLHQELAIESPLGAIDISFQRDDFSKHGLHSVERGSKLPMDVNDRDVILVDDILYTGRTVRAAMNELFDYGRPRRIVLVCLISRDGRELPIQADVCAVTLTLADQQVIKLSGLSPLRLALQQRQTETGVSR